MEKAIISGISGQDGSYLAELLLSKGYEVHGLIRRSATDNLKNIRNILNDIELHYCDLTVDYSLAGILSKIHPHEFYNLAAQSDVGISFKDPEYTMQATGVSVLRVLEAIRSFAPGCKVYQASSSEMFGSADTPQDEMTPMNPNSPYGVAKLMGHKLARIYRVQYSMFIACGICFNHESIRRGLNFVTRKIAHGVAEIKAGRQDKLLLGNLSARRDWGYAPEYVKAMWLMLQQDEPRDYVIGTGETYSVEDFAREAFLNVGLDWNHYVLTDSQFIRPVEVPLLQAKPTRARLLLGWGAKVRFKELVRIMVEHELSEVGNLVELK